MRADARRNRDAILTAARASFEQAGALASLDGIAERAGVGNATLYRNFPSRDDLLAAVMAAEIRDMVAEADSLAATTEPGEALRRWLTALAWRLRIWHELPYCVAAAHRDPASPMTTAVSPLVACTAALLDAARTAGAASASVDADEVYQLVTALSWGIDRFGDDEQAATRRVALGTAGIFAVGPAPDVRPPG